MFDSQHIMDELMDKLVKEVAASLKESINQTVEREISKTLSKALVESEFYRRINDNMFNGLQTIYKEISSAKKSGNSNIDLHGQDPDQLFNEASDQLDKILQTTESATSEIMDIVEKHQDMQAQANKILHEMKSGGVTKEQLAKLREISDVLNQDLIQIMTTLSFQDITGQRIKLIINAIKKVEQIVFDLYMSTGLKLKAKASEPEKNLEEIEAEADRKVSELKGPQADSSQSDVDSLLAQLGL